MPNRNPHYDSRYQIRINPSSSRQEKAFQPNVFHPSPTNSFLTTSPHFSLASQRVSNISLLPNLNTFAGASGGNNFIADIRRPYYVNNSFPCSQRRRRRRRRGKGNKKGNKNSQVINTLFQRGSSIYHNKQYYNKYFFNWTRDIRNDSTDVRYQR